MVRIIVEVKDKAHDKQENKEHELKNNPEENCEKVDESNELMSEDLKLENQWQQVSIGFEMNMASSSSGMPTMYRGLLTQPPTM